MSSGHACDGAWLFGTLRGVRRVAAGIALPGKTFDTQIRGRGLGVSERGRPALWTLQSGQGEVVPFVPSAQYTSRHM